jgi:hypothetical protein
MADPETPPPIDHDRRVITLAVAPGSGARNRADALTQLAWAAATIMQDMVLPTPPYLTPHDAVAAARIREAAAITSVILEAHAMRGPLPTWWAHIRTGVWADLAAKLDEPAPLADQARAIFAAWFLDPSRLHLVDGRALEVLDQSMQSVADQRVFRRRLPAHHARLWGMTMDGARYLRARDIPLNLSGLSTINARYLDQLTRTQDRIIINNVAFRDETLARRIFCS